MTQAINLGKFFDSNFDYDIIICSSMIRTCMTAMLSLRSKPNTVIYFVPFINELESNNPIDKTNTAIDSSSLKRDIYPNKKWFEKNKQKNR